MHSLNIGGRPVLRPTGMRLNHIGGALDQLPSYRAGKSRSTRLVEYGRPTTESVSDNSRARKSSKLQRQERASRCPWVR